MDEQIRAMCVRVLSYVGAIGRAAGSDLESGRRHAAQPRPPELATPWHPAAMRTPLPQAPGVLGVAPLNRQGVLCLRQSPTFALESRGAMAG